MWSGTLATVGDELLHHSSDGAEEHSEEDQGNSQTKAEQQGNVERRWDVMTATAQSHEIGDGDSDDSGQQ